MQRDDAAELPVTHDRIQCFVQVFAELLPAPERQLVNDVTGEDVLLVKVARSLARARIKYVLPARLSARTLGVRTAPARAEVSRRIAETL